MPVSPKSKKVSLKFVVDCSVPVSDKIMDVAAYEKYVRDHFKVSGRTNNLEEGGVTIARDGSKLVLGAQSAVSKRYLKYLTKKYLKKHQLRDWLRVISTDKSTYTVKYFNVDQEESDADEE